MNKTTSRSFTALLALLFCQTAAFSQVTYKGPASSSDSTRISPFSQNVDSIQIKPIFSSADSVFPNSAKVKMVRVPPAYAHVVYRGRFEYLAPTTGKTGVELIKALHEITAANFHSLGYAQARKVMYGVADNVEINGVRGILTAYSQVFVPGTSDNGDNYKEIGDRNGDGIMDPGINAEHSWPQSFFKKAEPMRSDMHHLQSTFITPNGRRGNMPYGMVQGAPDYKLLSGTKRGSGVYEPSDRTKGNTARALLYFMIRYYDRPIANMDKRNFWTDRVDTLLYWNRMDPPDAMEVRRNDIVEKAQGNRNPFIDDYTLADRIGPEALKAF